MATLLPQTTTTAGLRTAYSAKALYRTNVSRETFGVESRKSSEAMSGLPDRNRLGLGLSGAACKRIGIALRIAPSTFPAPISPPPWKASLQERTANRAADHKPVQAKRFAGPSRIPRFLRCRPFLNANPAKMPTLPECRSLPNAAPIRIRPPRAAMERLFRTSAFRKLIDEQMFHVKHPG